MKTILNRGAVDLRDQPARIGQCHAVEPYSPSDLEQLRRRLAESASPVHRRRKMPSSPLSGARPRFSAPITLVVIPEECQSMPITAPNDWNQKG